MGHISAYDAHDLGLDLRIDGLEEFLHICNFLVENVLILTRGNTIALIENALGHGVTHR